MEPETQGQDAYPPATRHCARLRASRDDRASKSFASRIAIERSAAACHSLGARHRHGNLRLGRWFFGWPMTYLPPVLQIGSSHEVMGALLARTRALHGMDQPRAVRR